MIKFAPSVLSADFTRLGEHIREAADAGAHMIHFDVMDGHFVPNITFGPMVIKWARSCTDLPFETHLMITNPENYVEEFVKAGSDIVLVHPEVCPHLHRVLQQIRAAGAKAGVALNPSTPLESIQYVLDEIDAILIMTVNPGFGGQEFIPEMLKKISRTASIIQQTGREIALGVDGGVNPLTAPKVVEAGANVLIAGSNVFAGEGTVAENLATLAASLVRSPLEAG